MANKVFHIRVKVSSHIVFYLKGVCLAPNKKKAIEHTEKEVEQWLEKSPYGKGAKITIMECKVLRSDFLIQTK